MTVRSAVASGLVPCDEVAAKAAVAVPTVADVTSADTVQVAPTARLPPERLMVSALAFAVAVPLQSLPRLGVPATTAPVGNAAEKSMSVTVTRAMFVTT